MCLRAWYIGEFVSQFVVLSLTFSFVMVPTGDRSTEYCVKEI